MRKPQLSDCCIYCDYENYFDLVKEAAIELVKKFNATADAEEQIHEDDAIFFYKDEAVDIVANDPDVETECIKCSDGYDD